MQVEFHLVFANIAHTGGSYPSHPVKQDPLPSIAGCKPYAFTVGWKFKLTDPPPMA